jgi:hypothetical protein
VNRWIGVLLAALLAGAAGWMLGRGGRADGDGQPRVEARDPASSPDTVAAGDSAAVVRAGPLPRLYRSLLDTATVDVDGDGEGERVELYADVGLEDDGRPMWDDGQRWQLVVRDGDRAYTLSDDFVQLGTLGFSAVERAAGRGAAILVETQAGSGVVVEAFVFDAVRGGFVRAGRLEAVGNVVHRPKELH